MAAVSCGSDCFMEQLCGRIGAACRRFADRGAWPADRVCGDDTTRARRCSCDGGGLHRARHYRCAALRLAAARLIARPWLRGGAPFLGSLWTVPARMDHGAGTGKRHPRCLGSGGDSGGGEAAQWPGTRQRWVARPCCLVRISQTCRRPALIIATPPARPTAHLAGQAHAREALCALHQLQPHHAHALQS